MLETVGLITRTELIRNLAIERIHQNLHSRDIAAAQNANQSAVVDHGNTADSVF